MALAFLASIVWKDFSFELAAAWDAFIVDGILFGRNGVMVDDEALVGLLVAWLLPASVIIGMTRSRPSMSDPGKVGAAQRNSPLHADEGHCRRR